MQRLLLTLEGIEGSGKSTQAQRLKAFLDSRGIPSILTREPGGSPLGERIREMILTPGKEPLTPEAEVLLFLAARAQHVRRIIGPALDKGEVVICDRFTDATLAYQGGNGTISDELLRSLNRWATGAISPTRTYLIDVPVDVGLARRRVGEPSRHRTVSSRRAPRSLRPFGSDTWKSHVQNRNDLSFLGVRIRRR